MSYSETEYIEICKRQLEDKFSFGNGYGYTQKDLELLSNYIESEKGIYISLSTLKRLWKNDFKQGPQLATLNALVSVLDYDNWQQFKLQNKQSIKNSVVNGSQNQGRTLTRSLILKAGLGLVLFLGVIACWFIFNADRGGISINGPVVFGAEKTISKGVPNTTIFNYDVSNVEADSFFIQQSWNKWRRERIDPTKKVFSSIYYESGFHRARLIANDSVIAMQPIHILSDGWEPHVYYHESDEQFIDFKGDSFIANGQLHLPESLLVKKIDTSRDFIARISHSMDYEVPSDNFSFKTKVKSDKMTDSNCPWMNVYIVTEKHIFYVNLVRRGCEIYGAYKMGEIIRGGKDNNLALLGQDLNEWQEVGINVKEKKAQIFIDGQLAYTETFKEDFGKIMGLTYIFDGKGSIDEVTLADTEGTIFFWDDFDR